MPEDESRPMPEQMTTSVEVEAAPEAVWAAIADPDRRADWLDDEDASARTVRIDAVDTGRRLVWTWWRPDGVEPGASTVEIALSPLVGGGTRVVVTETPLWAWPAGASASASAATGTAATGTAARRWDHRLLGLELLFVAAGACAF